MMCRGGDQFFEMDCSIMVAGYRFDWVQKGGSLSSIIDIGLFLTITGRLPCIVKLLEN